MEHTAALLGVQRVEGGGCVETKPCSNCGDEKPLTDFHRKKASKDGLASYCKACAIEDAAARREAPRYRTGEKECCNY